MDKVYKRSFLILTAGIAVLAICGLIYLMRASVEYPNEDVNAVSTNLTRDVELMWETSPLKGNPGPVDVKIPKGSTNAAIAAAVRVFNTVKFPGMTKAEVIAAVGDPETSSDSLYNFSFYPVEGEALVYRFDSGNGGWQFNLMMDAAGKVQKVERLGIE